MNKFKFYFIVISASVLFFSCSKKDDEVPITPPVAFDVQYPIDIALIEDYLKNNYIDVVNDKPGTVYDQDVTILPLPADGSKVSIYSYLNSSTYPKLLIRPVKIHNLDYKLYYLVLRPGVGISPCNVDGVLASYKGTYLSRSAATATPPSVLTATFFEELKYPQTMMGLFELIRGWKEVFPQFKTGTSTINSDGTVSHTDFGAGVMFIPSGLGYYSQSQSSIPAYSPLVFSFKLYASQRVDIDDFKRIGPGANDYTVNPDGILSYQEDLDSDGYVWTKGELPEGAINPDDSDGDGTPDFLDIDDDNDNYTTKLEIKNPSTGLSYPFDNIPTCTSGKKNYLDSSCHP